MNKKNFNNYKKIAIPLICVVLGLAMLGVGLFFIFTKPKPEHNDNKECVFHLDDDKNGVCDVCQMTLNLPVEDENPSDTPEDPPVDETIDYTTNVPNAVELLNTALGNKIDINTLPSYFRFIASLMNIAMKGGMSNAIQGTITNIDISEDKLIILSKDDNDKEWTTYMLLKDGGAYLVTTDGQEYETVFEKLDTTVDLSMLPAVSEEDVSYDSTTGYFVIRDEYMKYAVPTLLPSLDFIPRNEHVNIPAIADNLTYTAKFKVTANNQISDFIVKGVSEDMGLSTDVLAFVYKNTETETNITSIINYVVVIKNNVQYTIVSEDKATLNVSFSLIPPVGIGLEKQESNLTADINLKNNTISFPNPVADAIEKAREQFNKELAIAEKYFSGFDADVNCSDVVVFDEQYNVYIFLGYNLQTNRYRYFGYNETYDKNEYCLGEIVENKLIIKEHYPNETADVGIEEKYSGIFTCNDEHDNIVVFDEQYKVYVKFTRQMTDGNNAFVKVGFIDNYVNQQCLATANVAEKTLTVTNHPETKDFAEAIRRMTFTCDDAGSECQMIFVYHEAGEQYVLFEKNSNGQWACCGYVSWSDFCQGEIDVESGTITIRKHDHN